jgi:hypothetical protein
MQNANSVEVSEAWLAMWDWLLSDEEEISDERCVSESATKPQ